MNDTFLKACRGEKVQFTPVWIMRQAGRYLKEYRSVRSKADFLTMCKNPELVAEVTLQPIDILNVDAAILFSDILIPCEAMGQGLDFQENKGPILFPAIRDEDTVNNLSVPDPEDTMKFVMDSIRLLRKELAGRVPLIGFAGAFVYLYPQMSFVMLWYQPTAYRDSATRKALSASFGLTPPAPWTAAMPSSVRW